jgi:hypothetical protein
LTFFCQAALRFGCATLNSAVELYFTPPIHSCSINTKNSVNPLNPAGQAVSSVHLSNL